MAARGRTKSLPIALLKARERVMGPLRGLLQETGLTEQQWRVLRALAEHGPMEPTEISSRSFLLMPSLSRILTTLDEKHFISRTQDPNDRRRITVRITNTGLSVLRFNAPESEKIFEQLEDKLGDDKMEQLLKLLDELDAIDL